MEDKERTIQILAETIDRLKQDDRITEQID